MKNIFLFVIFALILFVSCTQGKPEKRILFDFESDEELDQIQWKCKTLFSLSPDFASHGKKSLKMELYPSPYPGLTPFLSLTDWSGYKALCFDIYNPEHHNLSITVRIDDRKDVIRYEDRYNKNFILRPGSNRLEIPLNTLLTSGSGKSMDLENICKFIIFMVNPRSRVSLYIDYLRLEVSG